MNNDDMKIRDEVLEQMKEEHYITDADLSYEQWKNNLIIAKSIRLARADDLTKLKKLIISLTESLADLEHDRWSRWERYRQSLVDRLNSFPTPQEEFERVEGWKRKREIAYSQLTEQEKESDRIEAKKTQELILEAIDDAFKSDASTDET